MSDNDPFASLRVKFLDRCRSDAKLLRALSEDDPSMLHIVHRLSGSAGTFGYFELSEAAEALEDRLREEEPASGELGRLLELLETVQAD